MLGRALVRPLLDERGELKVVTVDRAIEEECARSLSPQPATAGQPARHPAQHTARRVCDGLKRVIWGAGYNGAPNPVVSVSGTLPTAAAAGAVYSENSRPCSHGDSAGGDGAVDRSLLR
jgi:hypothetical protein